MATYYYTLGSYLSAWSTTNTTTVLNDGSAGDTTTFLSQASDGASQAFMTAFYDFGSAGTISANQFTYKDSNGVAGTETLTWTLQGATATAGPWTTIATNNIIFSNSNFNTQSDSSLSGTYQYYRLGFSCVGDVTPYTLYMSDWRPTISAGGGGGSSSVIFHNNMTGGSIQRIL